MRPEHLRQADLNLLVVFAILAEECSVSAAATRLHLSQPAVSRALQRLQGMFNDRLLVRSKQRYELTPQGKRILAELEQVLPRLDQMLRGADFDPRAEAVVFRVAGSDYSCSIFAPHLAQRLCMASQVSLEFAPWNAQVLQDIERGRIDLAFHTQDGLPPPHFKSAFLFNEQLVCVVATAHPCGTALSLQAYVEAAHVVVSILGTEQTIPDRPLAKLGIKRTSRLRIPYFGAAMDAVAQTDMVATIPERQARQHVKGRRDIRCVEPPSEVQGYQYIMLWHPRQDNDSAHRWLRAQVQAVAAALL